MGSEKSKKEEKLAPEVQEAIADGISVEREHKDTYEWLKEYLEKHGELPPAEEMYKHISQDHVVKEGRRYYVMLEQMEAELKKDPDGSKAADARRRVRADKVFGVKPFDDLFSEITKMAMKLGYSKEKLDRIQTLALDAHHAIYNAGYDKAKEWYEAGSKDTAGAAGWTSKDLACRLGPVKCTLWVSPSHSDEPLSLPAEPLSSELESLNREIRSVPGFSFTFSQDFGANGIGAEITFEPKQWNLSAFEDFYRGCGLLQDRLIQWTSEFIAHVRDANRGKAAEGMFDGVFGRAAAVSEGMQNMVSKLVFEMTKTLLEEPQSPHQYVDLSYVGSISIDASEDAAEETLNDLRRVLERIVPRYPSMKKYRKRLETAINSIRVRSKQAAAEKRRRAEDGDVPKGSAYTVTLYSSMGDILSKYTVDGTSKKDVEKDAAEVLAIVGGTSMDVKQLRKPTKAGSNAPGSGEVSDRSNDDTPEGDGGAAERAAAAVFTGAVDPRREMPSQSRPQRYRPKNTELSVAKKVSDKEGATQADKQRTRPLLSSPGSAGPGMGGTAVLKKPGVRAVRRDTAVLAPYRIVSVHDASFDVLAKCIKETEFWHHIAATEVERIAAALPDDVGNKQSRAAIVFLEEERNGAAVWFRENFGDQAESVLKSRFSAFVDTDMLAKELAKQK